MRLRTPRARVTMWRAKNEPKVRWMFWRARNEPKVRSTLKRTSRRIKQVPQTLVNAMPTRTKKSSRRRIFAAGAVGAAFAYLFDPAMGRSRRTQMRDRALGLVRRSGRRVGRAGRTVGAEAYGLKQKATHLREEPKEYDDVTLVSKIQSEILGRPGTSGERISVDAFKGVVTLRGALSDPSEIKKLERAVARTPGVVRVENLLHLEGTPAPNKEEALRAGR